MARPVRDGKSDGYIFPATTLHQPWASALADGFKTAETRSWCPPQRLIGQWIAIHAGMAQWHHTLRIAPELFDALKDAYGHSLLSLIKRLDDARGHVIAVGRLAWAACVVEERESDEHPEGLVLARTSLKEDAQSYLEPVDVWGDFSIGRWLWKFEDVTLIKPWALRGFQGFWGATIPDAQFINGRPWEKE